MDLLRFLLQSSRRMTVIIAIAGAISGLFSAALIALINTAVHNDAPTIIVLGVFATGIAKVITSLYSRWLMTKFGQDTMIKIMTDMARRVLKSPFRQLEALGGHRILTALTGDVQVLGAGVLAIPNLVVNVAIVFGCWVYLAWLSPVGLIALTVCVVLGAGIYKFLHATAFSAIFAAREERDRLMWGLRSLTDGIKELKMHQSRSEDFLSQDIYETAMRMRDFNLTAAKKYMAVDAWSQGLFYILIGGVLALFPMIDAGTPEVMTGYIFASLYVMSPVWGIIGAIPTFVSGQVSLGKLEELGVSLDEGATEIAALEEDYKLSEAPVIAIRDLNFHYTDNDSEDRTFSLGPIDFDLKPGEVVFLVGGNGSGKSTLVKLLAGLYLADTGEVKLGGTTIDASNLEWYRQHFSVVFSDFYLFSRLLGSMLPDLDGTSNEILKKLELDHKVQVQEGKFSTTALSQGQRKRLALLTALIEDRPIHIFDEWAADQDPYYKEIFYSQLLPELRAQGRAVLVVTHDDRYFHLGDRIIKLDDGKLVPATGTPPAADNSPNIATSA